MSSAAVAPSPGRNLSAGATALFAAQLIAPGSMYGDRLNRLDPRNNTVGSSWQTPTAILPGRVFKVGVQMEF